MAQVRIETNAQSQSDKFAEAARQAECDPDEKRWEERLRKVAAQKPEPEKPGPPGL